MIGTRQGIRIMYWILGSFNVWYVPDGVISGSATGRPAGNAVGHGGRDGLARACVAALCAVHVERVWY